jgi:hypothetical protein
LPLLDEGVLHQLLGGRARVGVLDQAERHKVVETLRQTTAVRPQQQGFNILPPTHQRPFRAI